MSETSSRKPWLWVGVGCLALSLLLICGGVLVCGGFLGGTGLLFSEIQAESVAASELSAREHVQGHAGLLAATGAVVAITTLSTEVVLDEAEVVLQVEGALATVSATVYLREQGEIWTAVGMTASGPGIELSEGEILSVGSSGGGGDFDWD